MLNYFKLYDHKQIITTVSAEFFGIKCPLSTNNKSWLSMLNIFDLMPMAYNADLSHGLYEALLLLYGLTGQLCLLQHLQLQQSLQLYPLLSLLVLKHLKIEIKKWVFRIASINFSVWLMVVWCFVMCISYYIKLTYHYWIVTINVFLKEKTNQIVNDQLNSKIFFFKFYIYTQKDHCKKGRISISWAKRALSWYIRKINC